MAKLPALFAVFGSATLAIVVLVNLYFVCKRDLARALASNSDLTAQLATKTLQIGELRDAHQQDEVSHDEEEESMRRLVATLKEEKQGLGVQFATLQAEMEQMQAEVNEKNELVDRVASLQAELQHAKTQSELRERQIQETLREQQEGLKEEQVRQMRSVLTKQAPAPPPPCPPCECAKSAAATLLSPAAAGGDFDVSNFVGDVARAIEFAEARYWYQRGEARQQLNPVFARYGANWPCLWGEELVGRGEGDGLKWMCGAQFLTKPCVVYSFGSRGNIDFELGVLDLHPHCEVHVFDPTVPRPRHAPPEMYYDEIGLAAKSGAVHLQGPHADVESEEGGVFRVRTLENIMKRKKHKHVDVLKIDIETMEFDVVASLAEHGWPSVGQLLLEAHLEQQGHGGGDMQTLFTNIEKADFRLFHREPNWEFGSSCCIEYSFIQRDYAPATKHFSMVSPPYYEPPLKTYPMPQTLIDKYMKGIEGNEDTNETVDAREL